MSITKKPFGTTKNGETVALFTLTNSSGANVGVITYGGSLVFINVPDKTGKLVDVCLGCDTVADYEKQDASLGALVGRFANRIEKGIFTLNGVEYHLYCNNGNNHLHGGKIGFNQRVWNGEIKGDALELSLFSPNGEEGYPSNLTVKVIYRFTDDNELFIDYSAVTDQDTIINLTNHCYFNLAGEGNGTILNHKLMLNCDTYTENSSECLPTGVIAPVAGTPLDFTTFETIGKRIEDDYIQLKNCGGYDHNFIIRRTSEGLAEAAQLWEESTGILMKTFTTKPGVQLYTGNFLQSNFTAKGGKTYGKRTGVCLETQFYPNAMKHTHFPSPVLRAGDTYRHTTVYRFEVK
ncbi:aldose 1-epimerase [Hydrogenoanaerobacterium saccharovorans]|uniref:Aldose 1-epimerase n=1 Tax=Hydrogenoanaerobacterium saccharovorans TaxID=474960 RepID=A0A1H8A5S6_9FIRM|nr:aldose epimerase family protein [Hydrogenoanaerobacterium saccharovorans]RPF48153.1 aldose 1-epimerase [Hydrogenoanaerobacterium saccharovorans]SEM65836.1 aldose 1-epimerase [Hydrogenoanaerobacterium saccharovorans]